MPTDNSRATGAPLPPLPIIMGGHEIYDHIMGGIEPELVSTVVKTLKEKYKNETPAQAKERGARYKKAFKEYDRRYAEYIQNLRAIVKEYQHAAVSSLEQNDRATEEQALHSLESNISHS